MKSRRTAKHGALLALAATALLVAPRPATAGNWNVKSVPDLIAAIHAANQAGGANTIILAGGRTYTLTAVDNTTDSPNGLPVIAANNLTIQGNGATIARSTAPGTSAFRLFEVAPTAALTLQNVILANGLVIGAPGRDGIGGAILNAAGATLTVKNSTLVGNQCVGGDGSQSLGGGGLGGAVWNNGIASFDHDIFSGNQVTGGATRNPSGKGVGGFAVGGAVKNGTAGTVTVSNCRFTGNKAIGGLRHKPSTPFPDGMGSSGAIDNENIVLVTDSTFTDNQGLGGPADPGVDGGYGIAGAIASGGPAAQAGLLTILRCTFTHNQAIGGDGDPDSLGGLGIDGAVGQIAATMIIADSAFTNNQAIGASGGGLGGWGQAGAVGSESPDWPTAISSIVSITNCTFADNQALGRGAGAAGLGGAVWNADWLNDASRATMVISDCRFTGNESRGSTGSGAPPTTVLARRSAESGGWPMSSFGQSGAVDNSGQLTILRCAFHDNRAIGGILLPGITPDAMNAGGGIGSWAGTLEVRESSFVGNQVIGAEGSAGSGKIPGSAGSIAMGGGITILSGLTATIADCWFSDNTVTGGAGGGSFPGGNGVGGALSVGFNPNLGFSDIGTSTTVTISGTTITRNQAIGGAESGEGMGGGYAVGIGNLFGIRDTSSVTLNGGSVVTNNLPDDIFQF